MSCVRLGTICSEIQGSIAVVSQVVPGHPASLVCRGSPSSFAPGHYAVCYVSQGSENET